MCEKPEIARNLWRAGGLNPDYAPGDLMLMYGTTLFLVATVSEPVTSEVMWGTIGAFPGTFNLAGSFTLSVQK